MDKLKDEALKRADILNASAAWGSDWDAHLLSSLVRRVEALEATLRQIATSGNSINARLAQGALEE
jgi:hypothetical protein